ncbi:MAG: site-specific integrase [Snowella sp.]|nr:site-specific integrase [Snowella sp.]
MFRVSLYDVIESYRQWLIPKIGEAAANKKILKLKTLLFQILYPRMGQPNHSRKDNQALLSKIPVHGFIETYDAGIRNDIETLKTQGDKSAPTHLSVWKEFSSWLSDRPDYVSKPNPDAIALLEPKLSFPKRAASGKALDILIPRENPNRDYLKYGVLENELTPEWQQNLANLKKFCNVITPEEENRLYRERGRKQNKKGMREVSFQSHKNHLLEYLGWFTKYEINPTTGHPYQLSDVSISLLYDINPLKRHILWHLEVRHNSYTTINHICNMVIKVAQWDLQLPTHIPRAQCHSHIRDLMEIRSQYNPKYGLKVRTSPDAIEKRMMEHDECEQIVAYLRRKAIYIKQQWELGKEKRQYMENVWMDYLLIALLVYGGMRIREIYQMELRGKRLYFNEAEGCYWCYLFPSEHKTSGDRAYPLFPGPLQQQLTDDLTCYLNQVRPQLPHNFVFFNRGRGGILRGNIIQNRPSRLVERIMLNTSHEIFGEEKAKAMTPHDFRRSSATWFAHYGHIEDAAIFAQLHGHSVDMLLKLYAQVRTEELTKQATSAYNRTDARAKLLQQQGTGQDLRVKLKRHIDSASPTALTKLATLIDQGLLA